jgi:thiol:disulfide interchange protein DsbC
MTMNEPRTRATRGARGLMFAPVFAGLLAAVIALPCAAESAKSAATSTATTTANTTTAAIAMGNRLQALYPSTRFGAVNPTPWPGVFEVVMGTNLAYVDQSGQYFLFGHLYDMKSQRDLTAERKDTLARIDFDALPLALTR